MRSTFLVWLALIAGAQSPALAETFNYAGQAVVLDTPAG